MIVEMNQLENVNNILNEALRAGWKLDIAASDPQFLRQGAQVLIWVRLTGPSFDAEKVTVTYGAHGFTPLDAIAQIAATWMYERDARKVVARKSEPPQTLRTGG
jgi:hypothetical protein